MKADKGIRDSVEDINLSKIDLDTDEGLQAIRDKVRLEDQEVVESKSIVELKTIEDDIKTEQKDTVAKDATNKQIEELKNSLKEQEKLFKKQKKEVNKVLKAAGKVSQTKYADIDSLLLDFDNVYLENAAEERGVSIQEIRQELSDERENQEASESKDLEIEKLTKKIADNVSLQKEVDYKFYEASVIKHYPSLKSTDVKKALDDIGENMNVEIDYSDEGQMSLVGNLLTGKLDTLVFDNNQKSNISNKALGSMNNLQAIGVGTESISVERRADIEMSKKVIANMFKKGDMTKAQYEQRLLEIEL